MRLRETNGDNGHSCDAERLLETHETQRDYWRLMRPMVTHKTQRDYWILMRLRETNGDQWELMRLR